MRKMMTKEVTFTTLKIAKMDVVDGKPVAIELPEMKLLGNISFEKAQKIVNKQHKEPVNIFQHFVDTETYEMEVDKFIKLASKVNKVVNK